MAGSAERADKLNYTLNWVVDLFEKHDITDWFIAYGTLLGVTREDSCIDGDDDVDICISKEHWDDLYDPLMKKNMLTQNTYYIRENFICTRKTEKLAQVDFYVCDVNELGDFNDTWEKVVWAGCYNEEGNLPTASFQGRKVNVPHNKIDKLECRYGSTGRQRIKRGTPAGDGYRNNTVI